MNHLVGLVASLSKEMRMVMLALVLAIPHSTHAQGTASANLNGTVHNSIGAVAPDADDWS